MSELLVEFVGVHCPQGSGLWNKDSVFWFVVFGVVTCCGEVGSNVDGEGNEFVCRGYIPGRRSCLLITSASPVILPMMVLAQSRFP